MTRPLRDCHCHRCQRRRYVVGILDAALCGLTIGCAIAALIMLDLI